MLWLRTETRLALFGVAGVTAVYLGFLGVPVAAAESFVKRGGYYVMWVAFGLFLHALGRFWGKRRPSLDPLTRRQTWLAAVAVALFSVLAITAEPFQSKILNDEFVLQSTAFNMHYFRDVATMVRGYDIQGVFLSTDNYLDKRPYFYPFLVSVVHDLTGYRLLNAYLVNAALMPVSLALAFIFGRQLAQWRGGMIAVLLLGTLPLLGQNASGSGMELLNVVMILAGLVLATEYLRDPTGESLAAFLLAIVLLAQSRYESALYALPAALIGVLGWTRARRVILPWQAILVPLLLIPCAMQNKVVSNSPVLWELTSQASTRFSLDYFHDNAVGAWNFLANTSPEMASSPVLSALGLAGLAWAAVQLVRARRMSHLAAEPARVALLCFSVAILGNTLLVFCYYWSNFSDRMAARFCLPLYLLMAFCGVLLTADLERRWPVARRLTFLTLLVAGCLATATFANHYYSHLGIDEIEWTRRYVNSLPPGPRLIITNRSTLPWLLEKKPSILIARARLVADRLKEQLQDANFAEVLVLQTLPPTSIEGDHQVLPEERLPGFTLKLLAERRFGSKLARISRLVAIDDSVLPLPKKPGPAPQTAHK
jgi:hypothetical protein